MKHNFRQSFPMESDKPLGGRYEIMQQLGAGGFGRTFLARDLHLPGHPTCVVKQLNPQVDSPEELQVARRLFDTEAQVLYRLGSHPQIPGLLAHFEDNAEFYLAQELIEGHSLTDELAAGTPWSDNQVIAFLEDILDTLAFVHTNQVIHRDIKPSNLIRRHRDNRIVLIDFGAVKQVNTQLSVAKSHLSHTISIGTQGYMPNEQIAGRPQFSSDVYAVGMIAIQALTGHSPETIDPDPQTAELDWHHLAPNSSPALKTLLDYMVRYDFRTRYATAKEALAALRATFSQQTVPSASVDSSTHSVTHPQPNSGLPYQQPSPSRMVQTVAVGRHPQRTEQADRRDPSATATVAKTSAAPSPRPRRSRTADRNVILPLSLGFCAVLGLGLFTWRLFASPPETTTVSTTDAETELETTATESPRDNEAASETTQARTSDTSEAEEQPSSDSVEDAANRDDASSNPASETAEESESQASTDPAPEPAAPPAPEPQPTKTPVATAPEPAPEPPPPAEAAPAITPETAQATVGTLYSYVSNQSWDAARSVFGGNLAQQFDPNFFQQFQRVTVENLRVTNQTGDTVELVGQNTYVYPDGSTQREERTFTVRMVDGQPRIVGSSFRGVIQPRSN